MNRQVMGLLVLLSTVFAVACSDRADGLTDSERNGKSLFILNCAPCHEDSNPELKVHPPRLNGMFSTGKLPSGEPATDEQVRETLVHGRGIMPAFDQRLTKDDVTDILNYLHTLK